MPNQAFNPIKSVDGVSIPCPSAYVYELEDVSAPGAGRTLDAKMHKKRIGQLVAIELTWDHIKTADVSAILTVFNPEYIQVVYHDAMQGAFVQAEFYVGNRSTPYYSQLLGIYKNLSFRIIKRSAK